MGIYLVHAVGFWDWLVDDGGISLTYARNLADGMGLVPQAGRVPTEAFSNPLWVGICAICMGLGMRDPYTWVTILNVIFWGILSYTWLVRGAKRLDIPQAWVFFFLLSLSVASPLIRWMNSGLENGLYLFLLSLFLLELSKKEEDKWSGIFLGFLALVRPEGILFSLLYLGLSSKDSLSIFLVSTIKRIVPVCLILGGYLCFRWIYFDDIFPNPFYAKASFDGISAFSPIKIHRLFRSVFGPAGGIMALIYVGATIFIFRKKWYTSTFYLPLLGLLVATLIFLLLPYDHLGWYRYATPFIFFALLYGFLLAHTFIQRVSLLSRWVPWGAWIWMGFSVAMGTYVSWGHIQHPTVPFSQVKKGYGHTLNSIGNQLGVPSGKVLVPDAGGAIWASDYEIYDFLGLLDKEMGSSFEKDSAIYCDYVFEVIRPNLIHGHGGWVEDKHWLRDPRLEENYVEVYSFKEPQLIKCWIRKGISEQNERNKVRQAGLMREILTY
ncbi:MAG: hypothetical protein AAFQ83_15100 [Bacteroidota bacterium]